MRQRKVTVGEVADGFKDRGEAGVVAYGGRLDVRPAYQREFVYDDAKRDAVVRSAMAGLPLNAMYWNKTADDRWEVLDGQQRTISLCSFVAGRFSVDGRYFHNLPADTRDALRSYELLVFECEGSDSERLSWFRTINVAGEKLTDQELRNAIYAGPWLADAKRRFSRTGCAAFKLAADYVRGAPIRQELLERAIRWAVSWENRRALEAAEKAEAPAPRPRTVEDYMGEHQADASADGLWAHFAEVVEWAKDTFPVKRRELRSVDWEALWEANHERRDLDAGALEAKVSRLMADPDVTRKQGAYAYALGDDERVLSIRSFDRNMRVEAWERQKHRCPLCVQEGDDREYGLDEMEADHILPWSKGGRTVGSNLMMVCPRHNREKGGS